MEINISEALLHVKTEFMTIVRNALVWEVDAKATLTKENTKEKIDG